jgi:hypothetical protein
MKTTLKSIGFLMLSIMILLCSCEVENLDDNEPDEITAHVSSGEPGVTPIQDAISHPFEDIIAYIDADQSAIFADEEGLMELQQVLELSMINGNWVLFDSTGNPQNLNLYPLQEFHSNFSRSIDHDDYTVIKNWYCRKFAGGICINAVDINQEFQFSYETPKGGLKICSPKPNSTCTYVWSKKKVTAWDKKNCKGNKTEKTIAVAICD